MLYKSFFSSANRYKLLSSLVFTLLCGSALAQTPPVVDTVISLSKTGSEPFDVDGFGNPIGWTGDGPGGAIVGGFNAGQDASEDDNVVRLQDSITYRVEVSVNDSDVADVGAQPVSSISADGVTLVCNLGPAVEGTTRVFFPAARAVGTSHCNLAPQIE